MLVNLTPHHLVLRPEVGMDVVLPPSGTVARVSSTPGALSTVPDIPVPVAGATTYGAVEGLPDAVEGTIYIVSALVLGALKGTGRFDVLAPGTGPNDNPVRNEKGQIAAVTRLVRF